MGEPRSSIFVLAVGVVHNNVSSLPLLLLPAVVVSSFSSSSPAFFVVVRGGERAGKGMMRMSFCFVLVELFLWTMLLLLLLGMQMECNVTKTSLFCVYNADLSSCQSSSIIIIFGLSCAKKLPEPMLCVAHRGALIQSDILKILAGAPTSRNFLFWMYLPIYRYT